ncbi:terminase small subunit [Shewanella sp. T24-MNA-CIBAN-0130]|uniref:terminase small subunit n=1 Tax=Shewanella sp. T24-MNA-CIBAN-0130 TaxID=3140470 RepID=UPI00332F7495
MSANKEHYDWTQFKFTDRERLFVMEYLVDKCMKAAAVRAGLSEKSSESAGSRMYNTPRVKHAIDWHMARAFAKIEITSDRILQEIAATAFLDPRLAFKGNTNIDIDKLPEQVARAIDSIKITYLENGDIVHNIQFNPKLKGLELLGKNLKMFTEKVEISQRAKVIVHDYTGTKKAKAADTEES